MGIDQIRRNFVKSMSVKKFSYLGQFIQGLRTPVSSLVSPNFPRFDLIFPDCPFLSRINLTEFVAFQCESISAQGFSNPV